MSYYLQVTICIHKKRLNAHLAQDFFGGGVCREKSGKMELKSLSWSIQVYQNKNKISVYI